MMTSSLLSTFWMLRRVGLGGELVEDAGDPVAHVVGGPVDVAADG
jgi:hypothetical protein